MADSGVVHCSPDFKIYRRVVGSYKFMRASHIPLPRGLGINTFLVGLTAPVIGSHSHPTRYHKLITTRFISFYYIDARLHSRFLLTNATFQRVQQLINYTNLGAHVKSLGRTTCYFRAC